MTDNQLKAQGYLNSIRDIEKKLHNKRLELEALRYRASGAGAIRYDKDHVQTSPDDYLAMAIDDIVRIEKFISDTEAETEQKKGKAYAIVRMLERSEHRTFIEWYYLNGLSIRETSIRMCMSERSTYYLRDDSLECFGKILLKK